MHQTSRYERENFFPVIFLHEKLIKRKCDRYMLNLALGYHHLGHKVTLITSHFQNTETFDDCKFLEKAKIKYSGWWIPRSICGLFRGSMSSLKGLCMAFRIIFSDLDEKSTIVLGDVSLVTLYVLHWLTHYNLFYVESFEKLRNRQDFCEHTAYSPSLLEAKFIKLANEIILESAAFAEVFKKSFPAVKKEPIILYPAVDVGYWKEPGINIQRIIPDLMENSILFLSIGKYRRSSNFKLTLDAFELLLNLIADIETTKRFQLVIAGNCKSVNENLYYHELLAIAKEKVCASQVTVLNQLPIIHEKTLMEEAEILIFPSKSEVQANFLLKAMSLGKPIVATTKGIAPKLLQNRISGIMCDPEPVLMAQVLRKLMMSPHLPSFMGEIAKDTFEKNYSFKSFCTKLTEITTGKANSVLTSSRKSSDTDMY